MDKAPVKSVNKPQPKWAILHPLNFVVIGVFAGSISYVAVNYRTFLNQASESPSPLTNMFFPLVVLWCMCLAYFFGFFGISFLDKEYLTTGSPSTYGLQHLTEAEEED